MHAVYNYCGFVDIAAALSKLERTRSQARAGDGNRSSVAASRSRESGPSRGTSTKPDKR